MSDDYKTKSRILAAMKDVVRQGKYPKRLRISRDFETDMCLLGPDEVGKELAKSILRHGPRKAIQDQGNIIFGMEVVWDAEEFKVELE
jgi:hypothetical protein